MKPLARVNPNRFQKWVMEYGGPTTLAYNLNINRVTVGYWMRQQSCPKVDMIKRLVKLSGGELTYEIIIDGTSPDSLEGNQNAKIG